MARTIADDFVLAPLGAPEPEGRPDVRCTGCRAPLELHQPDPYQSERLVGTCPRCGAWYLIDLTVRIMARLPDGAALARRLGAAGGPTPA
jgi:hypothetical protein